MPTSYFADSANTLNAQIPTRCSGFAPQPVANEAFKREMCIKK
jgi:hypothetical protein